jgi:predicted RNA polymerase sigma factor
MIADGLTLVERTLGTSPVGLCQLQAAIAAVHDEVDGRVSQDPIRCSEAHSATTASRRPAGTVSSVAGGVLAQDAPPQQGGQ